MTKSMGIPSFVLSGTSSGSGKTTVSLGLMAAFRARGMRVIPFKCGPDFIDPGLHQLATGGEVSRNLDLWMCGEEFTRGTFCRHCQGGDIAIIEGVMGMFDGGLSSSGTLAQHLGLPGILVLDVRSMAESAAAVVKGFESYLPEAAPKGVILNRIAGDRHLQLVTDAIHAHCRAEVLGYLPRTIDFSIPSRHLGLLTGDEAPLSPEALHLLAASVASHIDLDRLIELCGTVPEATLAPLARDQPRLCRIGVARDRAFCFYYQDNLDLLCQAGAELVFFSPLTDRGLPENIDGLYLGGGYPELYAEQLSSNTKMLSAMNEWISGDKPVYCECGGFMYLTKGIVDQQDVFHPLVGAFPVTARMQEKRAALGYREVRTTHSCCFGPAGTLLRGHEFHYSFIDPMPADIPRIYEVNNGTVEGYRYRRVLGGYLHLHFGFSPQVVKEFINYCREKV